MVKQTVLHYPVYYSPVKRNELLIHITWINLQRIMLREKSQSQKVTYCVVPFLYHPCNVKIIEMASRLVVSRGQWEDAEVGRKSHGYERVWWWTHAPSWLCAHQYPVVILYCSLSRCDCWGEMDKEGIQDVYYFYNCVRACKYLKKLNNNNNNNNNNDEYALIISMCIWGGLLNQRGLS